MRYKPHCETSVYLGDGIWRELSDREAVSGRFDHLPRRVRPTKARRVFMA